MPRGCNAGSIFDTDGINDMRAAWFEAFGAANDVINVGELETPQPAADEVLVRLSRSGVNPSDVKKRAGAFPNLLNDGLVIPHSDGAGTIEAVGAQVPASRIGQRVWVYQAQYGRRLGTAAEFVAIDASRAVELPEAASFDIGSCMGIPAMTAHRCVFADGEVAGQTILITGGAGRVGYYAIQFASQAGARVITTASNEADRQACLAVGADAVVNHRDNNWSTAVLDINNGPIDRVIDVEFGANLPEVLKLIRTSGVIATYSSTQVREPQLPFLQMMFMDLTIRMVIVYAMPESAKRQAIEAITIGLQRQTLQHRVAAVLPLAETAKSHEMIESAGTRGCVLVGL